MEIYLTRIWDYLINVFQTTINQLFILFVPLFVLMFLLNFSAGLSARMSVRFWGKNLYLYGFAWFGCSVHELSHAFFALIFGHKIREIALFRPHSNGESMGHVSHSFNKKNIYQKSGNFFIGIGPLLTGGIVLYFSTLLLFRFSISDQPPFTISLKVFTDLNLLNQLAKDIWSNLISFLTLVFSGGQLVWWKPAVLIYLLYSTGSSMTLSKSDVDGALAGFLWVVVFMLIFNLLTLWIGGFATKYLYLGIRYTSGFYFLLILTFFANLFFIVILFILNLFKDFFVTGR
jgi:hypothetical protein